MLDRAFLRPPGGLAVRAEVACEDFIGLGEMLDLQAPVLVTAQKTMHEHQGRGAAPLAHEVQA
jgi:hypothetical protein